MLVQQHSAEVVTDPPPPTLTRPLLSDAGEWLEDMREFHT